MQWIEQMSETDGERSLSLASSGVQMPLGEQVVAQLRHLYSI